MKRKIFVLIMAFMLLFGLTGQAMAYFEDSHLFRVVYNVGGTYEIMTDLGGGYDKTSAFTGTKLFNTDNFTLSQLGISDWTNVRVAYFMRDALNLAKEAWTSGNLTGQSSARSKWSAYGGAVGSIEGANSGSGVAQNVNLQTISSSYKNKLPPLGTFAGLVNTASGEASLSGFSAAGLQYVDQKIYYYSSADTNQTGVAVYKIRTYEGGTSEINPVPVPAAVYLLGTGLLGLIGIRRKMTTA